MRSRISLEQWRALVAVVDAGGYAPAAEALSKSQSTVTYAVKTLEAALEVRCFEIVGRKAVLTATGELLYRRAKILLEDAGRLEQAARSVSAGWEAEIGISVEVLFPIWLLLECLDRFGRESPHTHVEVFESVMGGTQENLLRGLADLAITPRVPTGFVGEPLMNLRIIPVAHPDHPLHRLGRKLTLRDLRRHRHLVVRESGSERVTEVGFEGEQRWTVSTMATSIGAACRGYGFAWFPEHKIRDELAQGLLKPLPLRDGAERHITVYLVIADPDGMGPGLKRLVEIIRTTVREICLSNDS